MVYLWIKFKRVKTQITIVDKIRDNSNRVNISETSQKENVDFIDRKIDRAVGGVESFFKLATEDSRIFILVLSICANIYLTYKLIDTNEKMRDAVIEEVRRQVPAEVRKEASSQLKPVKDKVDTLYLESKDFFEKVTNGNNNE